MTLLGKYNRTIFTITLIALLIGGGSYAFIIRNIFIKQLDKSLLEEKLEIEEYIRANHAMMPMSQRTDQSVFYRITTKPLESRFISLNIYDSTDREYKPVRQLHFSNKVNGVNYHVVISRSQVETEDLILLILLITATAGVFIVAALFIVNRFVLKKLWQPFRHTLDQMKQFNLSSKADVTLSPTTISEFAELNRAFGQMAGKVVEDYEILKDFTNHASHEMQTPLAVINSRLDILIQDEALNENQMLQLQQIYDSVSRLSKLNHSLLLLARIENDQFKELKEVDISQVADEKLNSLIEWTEGKQLQIHKDLHSFTVTGDATLLEVLIGNLLTNAIRHTHKGGRIGITMNKQRALTITNSSNGPALATEIIFEKFKKGTESEGTGLGLAIVREICNLYQFTLQYRFDGSSHEFTIVF